MLGPLEVREDGHLIELGRQKRRALLALLLLRRGEVVSTDALVDGLWGEEPPRTARSALQNYVSQLRAALGPAVVVSRTGGYALEAGPEQLDLSRFERLLAQARDAPVADRDRTLEQALSLWRGPPLAGLELEPFASLECARLEELRAGAVEDLVDAKLALGRGPELVVQLEALIARHPFRERLRGQLMLALYRAGRQVEALEAYRKTRNTLVDELGIEPSQALHELEQAILRHDPRLAGRPPAHRDSSNATRRKTVTVLLAEVLGGELLDAEVLRATSFSVLARMRSILEMHGASVEQRAGEEMMAIFGIPRVREDDVLRAARAAAELRREGTGGTTGRRIELRIALETGEVLAGDEDAGHGFVVGPVVARVKRLLESAHAGEALVGTATASLLGSCGVSLGPASASGNALLLDVAATEVPERRSDTPLLGREAELAALEAAFARMTREGHSVVVLVLGEPGIGKTRLAGELGRRLAGSAEVFGGHCAPYGEAAAYEPFAEIVRAVREQRPLEARMAGEPDAELVVRKLAEVVGDAPAAGYEGERSWALRRLLERLACARPLVIVIDDLQWADPALLDLIDDLDRRRLGRVLTLALARPEVLDTRPDWNEKESVRLGPLAEDACGRLVAHLTDVADDIAASVVGAAGGNPLFLEQLVAYAADAQGIDTIPASLDALLGARLDRLSAPERLALQLAAVVGTEFSVGALQAMAAEADPRVVESDVRELSRKGLVTPSGPAAPAFRFHHVLIRDEAYHSIPQRLRSQLHERLADWVDSQRPGSRSDEVVGHHLERAYRCAAATGEAGGRGRRLALAAGGRLGAAGLRAARAGEIHSAAGLLERAVELAAPAETVRRDLLAELALVRWRRGEVEQAEAILGRAVSSARAERDKRAELRARLELANLRLFLAPEGGADRVLAIAGEALSVLEPLDDDRSLGRIWYAVAFVRGGFHCRYGESAEAAARAQRYFRRAGWPVAPCLQELAAALYYGPANVSEALDETARLLAEADRGGRANVLAFRAGLQAMSGHFDEARGTAHEAREIYDDLGWAVNVWTNCATVEGDVELLAGDVCAAEAVLAESCERLDAWGERAHLATQAAQLGEAVYRQGRFDDALHWSQVAADCAASDDAGAQFLWRSLRAKTLARRGDVDEAEALGLQAAERAARTDALSQRAQVLLDRAEVIVLSGDSSRAEAVTAEATRLLGAKGNAATLAGRQ